MKNGKYFDNDFVYSLKSCIFAHSKNGSLAEWLGAGLQNRRLRFESGRNLKNLITKLLLYLSGSYEVFI